MSSASLAWISTAMPLSARFRASLDEAYTILDWEGVSRDTHEEADWGFRAHLNSGIVRRPGNEGQLVPARWSAPVFLGFMWEGDMHSTHRSPSPDERLYSKS